MAKSSSRWRNAGWIVHAGAWRASVALSICLAAIAGRAHASGGGAAMVPALSGSDSAATSRVRHSPFEASLEPGLFVPSELAEVGLGFGVGLGARWRPLAAWALGLRGDFARFPSAEASASNPDPGVNVYALELVTRLYAALADEMDGHLQLNGGFAVFDPTARCSHNPGVLLGGAAGIERTVLPRLRLGFQAGYTASFQGGGCGNVLLTGPDADGGFPKFSPGFSFRLLATFSAG